MKAKKLTVPTEGTQPAVYKSPLENMISGTAASVKPSSNAVEKRPASFNLDRELLLQFKSACAQKGISMSSVVEQFIQDFISSK